MNGKLTLFGAVSALLIAAAPTPSPMLAKAKHLITARMTDPDSVKFRNTRLVKGTVEGSPVTVACGEYNARNKFGGYVGFSTFAYEQSFMHGALSRGADGDFSFFHNDGGTEMDHPEAFGAKNARILALCLGIG